MGVLWEHANSIEWASGAPAAGAKAYFYVGGTTTPLVVYSDAGEGTPITTPVVADANGRWPDVFIPFIASYDVLVQSAAGTQLYYPRLVPNPDPVTAATGTVSTSSAQVFQTGGMRFEVAIGTAPSGWVRANGLTIGNAVSGATERANADTVDLFTYLYNAAPDSVLAVSGGRGATAAADYAANKAIALPDMRGGFPVGADDMGNSAAGRFATATFQTGSATVAASVAGGDQGGGNTFTLLVANLAAHTHSTGTLTNANESAHTHSGTTGNQSAAHTHSGTTGGVSAQHTHSIGFSQATVQSGTGASGTTATPTTTSTESADHTHSFTTGNESANHNHSFTTGAGSAHTHAISGATASTGLGTPLSVLSRCTLGTWLIKL